MSNPNPYETPRAEDNDEGDGAATWRDRFLWSFFHAVSAASLSVAAVVSAFVLLVQLRVISTFHPEIVEGYLPWFYFSLGLAALAGMVMGIWRPNPTGLAYALIAPIVVELYAVAHTRYYLDFADFIPLFLLSSALKGATIAAILTRAAAVAREKEKPIAEDSHDE